MLLLLLCSADGATAPLRNASTGDGGGGWTTTRKPWQMSQQRQHQTSSEDSRNIENMESILVANMFLRHIKD
jgi:hypothetical protein